MIVVTSQNRTHFKVGKKQHGIFTDKINALTDVSYMIA